MRRQLPAAMGKVACKSGANLQSLWELITFGHAKQTIRGNRNLHSAMFGNGFNEVHRYAECLHFFDRAIKLAGGNSDAGFPFMAYEGKCEALAALGGQDEARQLLSVALAKARAFQRNRHQVQPLIPPGKLEAQTGNREQALGHLEQANELATKLI